MPPVRALLFFFAVGSIAGFAYLAAANRYHLPIFDDWLYRVTGVDGEAGYDEALLLTIVDGGVAGVVAWFIWGLIQRFASK